MDFASITDRALVIRALYDDHERRNYGRRWSTEELTLGLVGDVGDLAKLVQAQAGVRGGHPVVDHRHRREVQRRPRLQLRRDDGRDRGGADSAAVVACSLRSPVRVCGNVP